MPLSTRQAHAFASLPPRTLQTGEELHLPAGESPLLITLEVNRESHPLLLLPQTLLNRDDPRYRLFSPRHHQEGIGGVLLLEPEEPFYLGRKEAQALHLFGLPGGLPPKPLTLRLTRDGLSLRKNTDLLGCRIQPVAAEGVVVPLLEQREKNLARLRQEVLGGAAPAPLPAAAALTLLREVNATLAREPFRPPDDLGRPGSVVTLPGYLTPLLVGDLHGQVDNLLLLLASGHVLEELLAGRAALVLLGDAIHREEEARLADMDSSLLMMDLILQLKRRLPGRVFYLRGNHDTFSPTLTKRGVPQGKFWEERILAQRGEDYRQEMARFQERLPLVAVSPHMLACHAGPVKAIPTLDLMINAHRYPALARELISSRPTGPANLAGYSHRDVRRFRLAFGLASEVPFVVGHTPLSQGGCFWREAAEIPDFHVLYGANPRTACLLAIQEHRLFPVHLPGERMIEE